MPQIGLYKYSLLQSLQLFLAFVSGLSDNSRIFMMVTAAEYKSGFFLLFHAGWKVKTWYAVKERRALTTLLAR